MASSAKKEDKKAGAAAGLPAQSAVGESCAPDSYVQAPEGLFPAPLHPKDARGGRSAERFRCLGRAMAKALQDSRLLDIPFSYTFYRRAHPSAPTCFSEDVNPVHSVAIGLVPACKACPRKGCAERRCLSKSSPLL